MRGLIALQPPKAFASPALRAKFRSASPIKQGTRVLPREFPLHFLCNSLTFQPTNFPSRPTMRGRLPSGCRCRSRRWTCAWPRHEYTHIVHKRAGEVAEAILMHQELDADGLAYPWAKVHSLINPRLAVGSLMVDGLEDVAVTIGDVSILPREIGTAEAGVTVPVPEA